LKELAEPERLACPTKVPLMYQPGNVELLVHEVILADPKFCEYVPVVMFTCALQRPERRAKIKMYVFILNV
jgi:hypothetical protein